MALFAYVVNSPYGVYRVDPSLYDAGDYDEDYTDNEHARAWEDTEVDEREDIELVNFRKRAA